MGRADRLPTPEQLREAMSLDSENKLIWDWMWRRYPLIAADLDKYLTDHVIHQEYGTGADPE